MQSVGTGPGAFRALHTSIPLMWRRHLSIFRVLIGVLAVLLYLVQPVNFSVITAPLAIGYAGWAIYLTVRQPAWTLDYPVFLVGFDTFLFFLCALHPGDSGLWLATVAYFYVLLLSTLIYHWHIVITVVTAVLVFFLLANPDPAARLWPAVLLGGILAVVLALHRNAMEERLSVALKRSVLSRSEAEIAREQERQRIGADFHDGPLQSFISFQMRLEIVRKLMGRDAEEALRELVQLQDLGRAQVTELRAFVRGMQPAEVTPTTLGAAIREAIEHFERDSGVASELFCGDLSLVDEALTMDVLQIIREILNNIRKHSKASRITLEVDADIGSAMIRVQDDGTGFPFSGAYTLDELEVLRLGPRSIKRRVKTLGGELTLESRPMDGTSIRIRIPVAQ